MVTNKFASRLKIVGTAVMALTLTACYDPYPTPFKAGGNEDKVQPYYGAPATANPLPANPVPNHPALAENGRNGMHADAYSSGVHNYAGPLGTNPTVETAIPADYWRDKQILALAGTCITTGTTNADASELYLLCADLNVFKLLALDATDNFKRVAILTMPQRATPGESLDSQRSDTSGGMYFHIMEDEDGNDLIVTTDGDERVRVIKRTNDIDPENGHDFGFADVESYNVKPALQDDVLSKITDVMVDWKDTNYLWFISTDGSVGTINRTTSEVKTIELTHEDDGKVVNEVINNSLAVDENGVFIVSNKALHRMSVSESGAPNIDWRSEYESIGETQVIFADGSGTTPSVSGPNYVSITDGADPIKVNVFNRHTGALICSQPVFEEGASATENSLIAYYNEETGVTSIMVENNFGYELPIELFRNAKPIQESSPGLARVDVSPEGECSLVWTSNVTSPSTVPKLSTGSGLVYVYEPKFNDFDHNGYTTQDEIAWYFTAVNFDDGEIAYQVLTGTGRAYNVNWGATSITADGSAYVGTLRGILRVRDNP